MPVPAVGVTVPSAPLYSDQSMATDLPDTAMVWLPTLRALAVDTVVKSRSSKSVQDPPPEPATRSVNPTEVDSPPLVAWTRTCTASPVVLPLGAVQLGVVPVEPVTVMAPPVLACSTVVLSVAPSGLLMDSDRAPAETL